MKVEPSRHPCRDLVNADNANETLEYIYDAYGNPREADDWTEPLAGSLLAQRGFTGHVSETQVLETLVHQNLDVELIPTAKQVGKHLAKFGLINMNGRVYDPMLG